MLDYNALAERFLSILAPRESEARREAIAQSLRNIFYGHEMGTIFNVDYQDAKDRLSRAVDTAWDDGLRPRYPHRYSTGEFTPESKAIYNLSPIFGLHGSISAQKKLRAQLAQENPSAQCRADLTAFFDAVVPVALIVKELKAKVVKGRKPAPPEVQARREAMLAKKIVRTCPVCLRGIGLVRSLICDHGYTLPHRGWKTASCPGEQFPPLEESPAGVEHMIKLLRRWIGEYERQLAEAPTLTSITRQKPHSYRGERETLTPESPQWQQAYDNYVRALENDIRATKSSLVEFEKRLANWKPTPQGQRYSGGKRRHARPSVVGKLNAEVRGLLRK